MRLTNPCSLLNATIRFAHANGTPVQIGSGGDNVHQQKRLSTQTYQTATETLADLREFYECYPLRNDETFPILNDVSVHCRSEPGSEFTREYLVIFLEWHNRMNRGYISMRTGLQLK